VSESFGPKEDGVSDQFGILRNDEFRGFYKSRSVVTVVACGRL